MIFQMKKRSSSKGTIATSTTMTTTTTHSSTSRTGISPETSPRKKSGLLLGFRPIIGTSRYSHGIAEDEKKEDSHHSTSSSSHDEHEHHHDDEDEYAIPYRPIQCVAALAAGAASSPTTFGLTQAVEASAIVASQETAPRWSIPSARLSSRAAATATATGPVDLDDTIISEDSSSFLHETSSNNNSHGDLAAVDSNSNSNSMKQSSIEDLLGLGGGSGGGRGNHGFLHSGTSSRSNGSDDDEEEEDNGCLLFEDDDDDDRSPDFGFPTAAELPAPLCPAILFGGPTPPAHPSQVDTSITTRQEPVVEEDEGDEPHHDDEDYVSVQRTRSGAKPPTEINIDLCAVPPSPMRENSDASFTQGAAGGGAAALPMLLNHPNNSRRTTDSPPAEVQVDFGAELGLRTKLCDAERLVRIILGKTSNNNTNNTNNDQNDASPQSRYATLEHGSILQAIRSFAMMKQELIELRRQQESSAGDPPAILTNLTSPATTTTTSFFSTPAQGIVSPKSMDQPSSPLSPNTQPSGGSHNEHDVNNLWQRHQQSLRTTRNALVMAARKCQSLEQQLKQANETIEILHLEQNPQHCSNIQSLKERLQNLEAENRLLRNAQAEESPKTPAELEDILTKLHHVPASSVSHAERQKIRKYVVDMIDYSTKDQNQQAAMEESRRREVEANQSLQMAQDRIQSLQAQLARFTTGRRSNDDEDDEDTDEVVPNPLEEAHRELARKNERITQLEEAQVRLQSMVQTTVARQGKQPQPLKDLSSSWMTASTATTSKGRQLPSSERLRLLQMEHQALAESVRALEGHAIAL